MRKRCLIVAVFLLTIGLSGLPFLAGSHATAQSLPEKLTDQQFWKLSAELSEPDGTFRSDNLLSNELLFQYVIPDLTKSAKAGRVYMGVGPEQNFTYITALQPKMAFIVDIRRGNLDLHLMYKALFEISKDRPEFVSRLFSKKRPDGLTSKSTAIEIFDAYSKVDTNEALYKENLKAIKDQLTSKHAFDLSKGDWDGIEYVYGAFYQFGPNINYSSSGGSFGGRGFGGVTYWDLMVATDEAGEPRSYLANEQNFTFLKDLESKNLLVPVVGNFGGSKAIRAVGKYLKDIGATVSAFYLSNVEQYLRMDGIWTNFCENVATLPLDPTSTFIRSVRGAGYGGGNGGFINELGSMATEVKGCGAGSR